MATKDWKMDLDAFNDPNWGRTINGQYYELRIFPDVVGWALVLLTANSEYSTVSNRKTLKKGLSRDDIIKFAEDYIKKH